MFREEGKRNHELPEPFYKQTNLNLKIYEKENLRF